MIRVRDLNGKVHLVNPTEISRVSEAAASARWHGVASFVHLRDGTVIESIDGVAFIENLLAMPFGDLP